MPSDYEKVALEIARLVGKKNAQYGDSFNRAGEVLKVLYPHGVNPTQYTDLLCITRILDKLFRIANGQLEDSFDDIVGYGILGALRARGESLDPSNPQPSKDIGEIVPLRKGSSQKVISENIKELENSKTKAGKGRTQQQNIAIAESEARKSKSKK